MSEQELEALNPGNAKTLSGKELADEAVKRCTYIIDQVDRFKAPRIAKIQKYRDLYAGKVPPKLRQPFNVVLPVFAGAMDTLMAAYNDDISLEFEEQEPADYLAARKINALWRMEADSVAANASFAYKARADRSNALFSGRGFLMNYAVSEPEYCNHFEIYELDDAIFQPRGGGIIENHLYQGRANIIRSEAQLKEGSVYDKAQVKELLALAARTDFEPEDITADSRQTLTKYSAMSLDTKNADYVGERLFKLVEMAITIDGVRYYIVFSPWYKKWVRFDKLQAVFSSDLYPGTSWATHEDNRNFLSKSYADDLYGVADAVHTLFNQELTNREKRNFNARAYDREMVKDVAQLDRAQTRPDALVPIDTLGGTRKLSEAVYTFQTAELQGTINLIDWIKSTAGTSVGVTDLLEGGTQNVQKKATVVFTEQQNLSKRSLYRSASYTEALGRIGKLFIQSAKDHLPAKKALKRLGIEGQGWDAVIGRADLDLYADLDIRVRSSSLDMKNSQLKKEARLKTLESIAANPTELAQVNPRWLVEEKLRSAAEYDDAEIKIAMDTKNYGNKEEVAYAHEGIQEILAGHTPQPFYGATTLFMQIVHDFAVNNRQTLGTKKYAALLQYEMAHQSIAQENMLRKARTDGAQMAAGGLPAEAIVQDPNEPSPVPAPAAAPNAISDVRRTAAQLA
jgi:hypothetical protein